MVCHGYVWPQIYGMLMETSFGVEQAWGIHVEYMPRLYSLLWWSAGIPLLGVLCSLVPLYVVRMVRAVDLSRYRRMWYVCATVVASMVCPALPLVQFWCTLFLYLLYELTLVYLCMCESHG
jgi:Sec-independent protein secretion pathway component TatC